MGSYLFQDGQPIDGAKISFSETQPIVQVDFEPGKTPLDITSFFESIIGVKFWTTSASGQAIVVTGYEIIKEKYYLLFAYCGGSIYNVDTDTIKTIYIKNTQNDKDTIRLIIKEAPVNALVGVCTEGTIFVDGYFIYVPRSEVVVSLIPPKTDEKYDEYKNTEFHIGFDISRREVDATEDVTLNDNAVGSYNYKAPGANRYQIKATLNGYKSTEVPQNKVGDGIDFISGIIIKNSILLKEQPLEYDSNLRDMLARRTYEESGSYSVTPWKVTTDVLTDSDIIPNDDSDKRSSEEKRDDYYGVNISPGLGYIYGYRVSNLITERKLNKKPRSTIQKFNILNYTSDGMYVKANKNTNGSIDGKNFPGFMAELKILNVPLSSTSGAITQESIIGTCNLVEALYDTDDELRLYLTNLTLSKLEFSKARCLAIDKNTYINLRVVYDDDDTIIEEPILYGNENAKIVRTGYNMVSPENGLTTSLNYEYFDEFSVVANDGYIAIPKSNDEVKRIVYIYSTDDGTHISLSGTFEDNYTKWVSKNIVNGSTYKVCIIYERYNNGSSQIRNKFLKPAVETNCSYSGENFIELNNEDVFDIISLNITNINGTNVTDTENYKDFITLKNEQTDFLYKKGRLIKFQDLVSKLEEVNKKTVNTFKFNIEYRYFEHSDGVGPFTVSSYVKNNQKDENKCISYKDIPVYRSSNGEVYELRDCLDFRVKESSKNKILIPYKSSVKYDVSMYLPRLDRVWVDKSGNFGITQGIPSLSPELPAEKDGTMTLYYLHNEAYGEKVSVKYVNNKRHTMSDITKLENRITNVENVLSLSLLEQSAVNMQITDATTGLNRYKSGIFTDNFTLYDTHDCADEHWKCSIDAIESSLRPAFDCENIEFTYKNGDFITTWGDDIPRNNLGERITRNRPTIPDTILTLSPNDRVLWASNGACSEATNIQSLMFYVWIGELKITPSIDTWVNDLGNILVKETWTETPKPKTTYRSWSVTSVHDTKTSTSSSNSSNRRVVDRWGSYWTDTYRTTTTTTNTTYETKNTTETTSYVGSWEANEQYEKMESQDTYMRVRDVRFHLTGMRPGIKVTAKMDDKVLDIYPITEVGTVWTKIIPEKDSTADKNRNLIDSKGELRGCFTIPENMTCGTKLIQFYDDEDKCAASAEYTANGKTVWTEVTRNYIRTWTAVVSTDTQTTYRTTSNSTSSTTKLSSVYTNLDPIAESFYIDSPNGIMLESIDLFFAKKDDNVNVEVIVVECENGYPSQTMVPFSRVVKKPTEVNVVEIGNVSAENKPIATNFKFESPLYLYPETEYAFIVIAQSYGYELYTSTLGKADLITGIGIKEQPYIGSMFKSQNLRTWTAEQMSDIMFNIYKYEFNKNSIGTAYFDIVPFKDKNNLPMDFKSAMQTLSLNTFVPSQTEIKYFYNWDNTEWKPFNNKEDIFNDVEYSTYNTNANTDYQYLRIRCDLYTEDKNISPMIDLEQVYGIFTNNQCEEVKDAYDNFIEFDCGSYVSVPIKLANSGEDLRVILDAILPNNSRIAVSYKTTPIIQQYFNTGRIGCGSKLNEDDIKALKNKEVSFYYFDEHNKMKKIAGESRCIITDYAIVPNELVTTETIDGDIIKYTSTGRLYINNLSNYTIIEYPQIEKDGETRNVGYYVMMNDDITSEFEINQWHSPVYKEHDVVSHNNLLWVNINKHSGIIAEPTIDNDTYWTTVKNVAKVADIPTHDSSNKYVAWSLVKDSYGYYYISIIDVPAGQQLNEAGSYWRKVPAPTTWCYPQGLYVFYNDYLWKCVVENAGFNEPTDVATSWKKIHCVKLISPLKTKEDSDWCEMAIESNNKTLSSIDVESSFNEYTYYPKQEMTGDFTSFSLKIDMFSQDKVNVPRVKNLRAIALI